MKGRRNKTNSLLALQLNSRDFHSLLEGQNNRNHVAGCGDGSQAEHGTDAYSVPAGKRLQNEMGVLGHHYNSENKRKRYPKPLLRPKFETGCGVRGVVVRISIISDGSRTFSLGQSCPSRCRQRKTVPNLLLSPSQRHPSFGSPGFSTSKMA